MLKLIALILLNLTSYAVYSDVTCKASPIDQGKYLNRKPPKSWTNCHGVYNYLNSISTYTGNFISGMPNGSGMLEYRMGTSYVGEWLDGEFNGSGMIKNSDGSSIDGHWERNSFTGYGIIILPDVGTLKGNWSKDIFTDVVSIQYTDGTESSVDQMAKDVTTFLSWAAEPELEERHRTGVKVIIYLVLLTILVYLSMKKIWSRIDSEV